MPTDCSFTSVKCNGRYAYPRVSIKYLRKTFKCPILVPFISIFDIFKYCPSAMKYLIFSDLNKCANK